MKKKHKDNINHKTKLSASKKRIFWLITILLPVLFFLLLEIGLRIFNYDGNLDLFIKGPSGYENYLRCNPNVARRYFAIQSGIPTPPRQLFLRAKPKNGYRIFVLGGSSAAGFPYSSNVSFPNILERALSKTFPNRRIEVINVSMTAINSYSLLDFMDEILDQSPDAILIYAGHNEYYGALGVGSEQSIGNSRWLIHTYLKLHSMRTFLLIRDFADWIKIQYNKLFSGGSEIHPSSTFMEKIVAKQTIPFGSKLYEAGKEQFEDNLNEIIRKAVKQKIPVILSELVSNVRDQKPFISIKDKNGNSADKMFEIGKELEAKGKFEEANRYYKKGKDLDALRFRAPEDFNLILRKLAKKYSLPIVPAISYFEKESPHGIIGNNLILEHLHPNEKGYFLLAKGFYETMKNYHLISNVWTDDSIDQVKNQGITPFDSVYASLSIRHLKDSWPFQPKALPNNFMQNFHPQNQIEKIAYQVLEEDKFPEEGHILLGEYYEKTGDLEKAFLEYNALIASFPNEIGFYKKASSLLMKNKEYKKAEELLLESLKYKENYYAYKWLGQMAMLDKNFSKAIVFLEKADKNDVQVIFVLSSAYYFNKQVKKGDEYFVRLQGMNPKREYLSYLAKLRLQANYIKK